MAKVPTYVGWYRPHDPVDWDGLVADPKTGELVKEPSMTRQEFMHECDINNIVAAYSVTGMYTHMNAKASQGAFMDLPQPLEFQEALHIAQQAEQAFAALPSAVRNRFENDPGQFLEFMSNPANQDEAIKLGLATDNRPPAPPAPPPPPTPGGPPATPPPTVKDPT